MNKHEAKYCAAMASALDVADRLIERGYGVDKPPEWDLAYKDVQDAVTALWRPSAPPSPTRGRG